MRAHIIGQAAPQSNLCLVYFINPILLTRCLLTAALVLVLSGPIQAVYAVNLPTINTHSSTDMSVEDEYRFGTVIAGSIRKKVPLWNDLAALEFITDLTQPLISRSQLSNKNTQIFLVRDNNINAFAAPGGIIGVNTGLIQQAGAVDELVAVLAHEVAHLSLRHYVQTQAQEKAQAPLYLGAFIASIWLAEIVNGDIGEAGIYATQSVLQRSQLSYSRSHEREADRIGFDLMNQSPFDVIHMQRLLQRLQSPYVIESPQWDWARSHPISNERVADISQRMLITQKRQTDHGFDLSFELLKIYQTIALSGSPIPSVGQLMHEFDPLTNRYSSLMAFSQALVNQASGKVDVATQQLQDLALKQPNATLIWYSWMHSLLGQKQTQEVFKQLNIRKNHRRDNSLSLWINAQALRQDTQPKASISALLTVLKNQPTWIIGWRTLAEWSSEDQRLQLNHMAQSQWHLLRGETEQALKQAQYASKQQIDIQAGPVSVQRQKALTLLADQKEFN
jgi:predicted Zn-dependent protease